ncbi:hypothetical protein BEQ56_08510 [Anaerolineaceae bacterium oral taxon 439]|nr:hypothetical protein BEQ56_08510 [Anaerolineaceae bacterium oral taxon 439]
MKIVILDGWTTNPGDLSWEELETLGELTVYDRTDHQNLAGIVERIGGAEAVLTNKTPLPREVLDGCPTVKYIGVLATGYNVVDVPAAAERGITVTNIPSYGTEATAQHVFALLLEATNRVGAFDRAVHRGDWQRSIDFTFQLDRPLIELAGKTLGIFGFGRIGKAVGRIARAFGMNVIAASRSQSEEGKAIAEYVPVDELLARSDFISLNAALTPELVGFINRDRIAKMKDGVILINASRGPILNEGDVADALNSGKIGCAAIDVVSIEPIAAENPLLRAKNCLITPHVAWTPLETRKRLISIAAENLRAFVAGAPIHTVR